MPTGVWAYSAAFLAGLASFSSPCILPLIPTYLTFLGGQGGDLAEGGMAAVLRGRLLQNAAAFVIGFSTIFVLLGTSASVLGKLLLRHLPLLQQLGGLVVIVFGLDLLGLLRLDLLKRDWKVTYIPNRVNPLTSFLVGMAFSSGWTACVSPILGSILGYAALGQTAWFGASLLLAYAMGIGIPFLLAALFVGVAMRTIRRLGPVLAWVTRASGLMLVGFGLLLFTGQFSRLTAYLSTIRF